MKRYKLLLSSLVLLTLSATAQVTDTLKITNVAIRASGLALDWNPSASGTAYMVQYQDEPGDLIWRVPDSPTLFPISTNGWQDGPPTNRSRLYRVLAVPAAQRGKLLYAFSPRTVSAFELGLLFTLAGVPITPQYSVRLYRIRYETIDASGARTIASGALLLPENTGGLLPLTSYQHGTITQTNLAPSALDVSGEVSVGLALATTGYAVSMPDYLGLGNSPGLHPFHHARSEATACVDMLRAVRTFCSTNGFALTNRLFLAGYSQGGHATMSLCRELETFHTNEFTVTACAPMAGAYDLSGVTTTNFLAGNPSPNPYYLLYLVAAYQEVYHLGSSLADLLASPYDVTLPPLMKGNTSGDVINAAMPSDPLLILKPQYLAEFRSNPKHPLRIALRDNDVYRWHPRSPMRLYHCAADRDVIAANSQVAYASFQSNGATQVQFYDPDPAADHNGCAQPSLLLAKIWFDSLR